MFQAMVTHIWFLQRPPYISETGLPELPTNIFEKHPDFFNFLLFYNYKDSTKPFPDWNILFGVNPNPCSPAVATDIWLQNKQSLVLFEAGARFT